METSDGTAGLNFDRAAYTTEGGGGAAPCANCKGPLGEQYWHWQSQAVCDACRGRLAKVLELSQSNKSFGRAILLGGLAALGCGIAYAIFVAVSKYQLALITIGIAFVIAKVMRKCSAGVGGRRFQILAVGLTYLASAMGYAPSVYSSFKSAAQEDGTAETAAKANAPTSSSARLAQAEGRPGIGSVVVAYAFFIAVTLAAPVLAATDAPIGLLIVGFGLWEAWKLSRGIPLTFDGPYRAAPAATGPPVT